MLTEKFKIINNFNIKIGIIILKGDIPNLQTAKIQIIGELPCLKMDLN